MNRVEILALRHAIENASNEPVTDEGILAMLRGRGGSAPQLRALFEDSSLRAIARAGVATGLGLDTILAAYAKARETAAAVNPELDEALRGSW